MDQARAPDKSVGKMGWGRLQPPPHELPTSEPQFTVCKKGIGTYPARLGWGFELAGGSQKQRAWDTAKLTSGHDLGIIVDVLNNQDNIKAWLGGTLHYKRSSGSTHRGSSQSPILMSTSRSGVGRIETTLLGRVFTGLRTSEHGDSYWPPESSPSQTFPVTGSTWPFQDVLFHGQTVLRVRKFYFRLS